MPGQRVGPMLRKERDIRLDFFRGLALFIIYIVHAPLNPWTDYTPGKFGFSDTAEIFVFCSGAASAIAFGRIFDARGFWAGSARVLQRCWQVYWAHIGLFLAVLGSMILTDRWLEQGDAFVRGLHLDPIVSGDTASAIVGLLSLTYVPGLFDILPLYVVLLAMVPIVMALSRISLFAVLAFVGLVWAGGNAGLLELPAEPWSDKVWYFNPFAWQLVYFTGFALVRGWLPALPINSRAFVAAVVMLVLAVPIAHEATASSWWLAGAIRNALLPLIDKSHMGLLRFAHFLLLAYVAASLAGPNGVNLRRWADGGLVGGAIVAAVTTVGSRALPVFVAGIMLSVFTGVALNLIGSTFVTVPLVNAAAFAGMIGVAYLSRWYKHAPKRNSRAQVKQASVGHKSSEAVSEVADAAVTNSVGDGLELVTQQPKRAP